MDSNGYETPGSFAWSSDGSLGTAVIPLSQELESLANPGRFTEDGKRYIRSQIIESVLIDSVGKYVSVAKRLGLESPFVIMLSFTGVEGYQVLPDTHNRHWDSFRNPLDRDIILIPEVIVETAEFDVAAVLRPAFDTLWQSAGWPRSLNYEADGTHGPTSVKI